MFLRFKLSASITGIRPVEFPFKIFISGNLTGFQLIHPNYPFFQNIIQNPIIKPHTDRCMSRPVIIVMVVNGSVCYFIAFFTGKFLRKKQMQGRWIKFIQPEKIIEAEIKKQVNTSVRMDVMSIATRMKLPESVIRFMQLIWRVCEKWKRRSIRIWMICLLQTHKSRS